MDDVDAVQAQIARNMLDSGDWVTARLDGIAYLEKSPLKYWLIAISYKIFGVHDWAARLPVALSAVLLCWLVFRIGAWAFTVRAGLFAGLAMATSVGLWLFTRIQIPDVTITATIALAMWGFLRALDPEERSPGWWASAMAAAIGTGLLLKGLIAVLFPVAAAVIFLAVTGQIAARRTWERLHVLRGIGIALAIAAPWHVLATLRNPPYFDFTMHSAPGEYRGFFWFYFMNEHVLRFLNLRYPRDYNTVPRVYFWLFHLLWLFPWSVYFPAVCKLKFRGEDRASRMRLLCVCWAGFLLTFFTFSSTQEYYSMPCYPALALLVASALDQRYFSQEIDRWLLGGRIALTVIAGAAAVAVIAILSQVWNLPAPGDISRALTSHPEAYTLSLGHMGDLTIASFAYLKTPLVLAGIAFLVGAFLTARGTLFGGVVMMILFLHAARLALVVFDPYLASRALAEALNRAPRGTLILDDQYYTFSSVIFYAEAYHLQRVLLLNGRVNNLVYGSYAPGAPSDVFIDDAGFRERWQSPELFYICVEAPQVERLAALVGHGALHEVIESGGKFVFSNKPS
jgi:4-amino-4-deoxy-L-arabinose transferase-like glycosyltransferase